MEMNSRAGRTTGQAVPDPPAVFDVICSPAVERHLGTPNSAERRLRLAGIRRRLQTEGSPVVIKQPGAPPLIVYLEHDAHAGRECFHIIDLNELPAPTLAALNAVFGLSAAEARLAQCLARGESVESAAQLLDIKLTTVRSQLAAIFEKTGTRRQAKLAALLSRLAHMS
jgi:DNA-binding CsgD family transcriptional regulator